MDQSDLHQMRRKVAASPVVAKLQQAARDLLGGALLVLLRKGDEVVEVHPSDESDELPEFCRLYRSTKHGMECCMTCRSLMAFGTCYRGTIEYSCHGGVIIIASPAPALEDGRTQPIIASCAFTREDREEGWGELRDHAHGLGIDLRRLRAAYNRMPVLTDDRRKIASALVEVATAALGPQPAQSPPDSADPLPVDDEPPESKVAKLVGNALYIAHTQSEKQRDGSATELMIEQIQEMVTRDPTLPFTVKNIAEVARLTPNHFSTIFSKTTGKPFTAFLLEQRISLAKQWLRDLSLHVNEVGKRSGFPDGGYFTRRFHKATGLTPTQWRSSV